MVGRYPYCEPSRVVDREKGEAQMEKIMGAGITTFVCLQVCVCVQDARVVRSASPARLHPERGGGLHLPAEQGGWRPARVSKCKAGLGITPLQLRAQAELPPQAQMELRGVDGFLPYKATAEMIKSALSRWGPWLSVGSFGASLSWAGLGWAGPCKGPERAELLHA